MAAKVEELYSLLVPLTNGRLIVPRSCVAEVVRYSKPDRDPEYPGWLRGLVRWNDLRIPVVSFEELCGHESTEPGGRTRLVVFHGLTGSLSVGYLAVLAEGFPQMIRINSEVLKLDEDQKIADGSPVICHVRMINEHALIPDLELLEELLQQYLADGSQDAYPA